MLPASTVRILVPILVAVVPVIAGAPEDLAAIRAETNPSARKRMLQVFLKTHRPVPASTDVAIGGVYNDAVTLALAHKLKASYLTDRIDVRRFGADPKRENPHFTFDKIRGPRWKWQPPAKHDVLVRRKAGVLSRGAAREVRLHIWVYDLDQGNTQNPGGSPKRAAAVWLEAIRKQLRGATVRQKPTRKRFNRHYGNCTTFEIAGKTATAELEIHRCWFVLPKKGKLAMIQVIARDNDPDPELDVMLATLRDP